MEMFAQQLTKDGRSYDPYKERYGLLNFGNIRDKQILDIGTGKGFLAIIAAKAFNCSVTSIDTSVDKLNIAKKSAKKEGISDKIIFKIDDATRLSFGDNTFDTVVCYNALHHIPKSRRIISLKEMFRVAKEDLIIAELHEKGIALFDTVFHPEENHKKMEVDLRQLENDLSAFGKIRTEKTGVCNFYSVNKSG